jgi:Tol biopolymer transport system component
VPGAEIKLNSMPQLNPIVERCLNADPDMRWQSAADLAWQLSSLAQSTPRDSSKTTASRWPWLVAAAFGVLAVGLGIAWLAKPRTGTATDPLAVQFTAALDDFVPEGFVALPAPSPDGRYLAFRGKDSNGRFNVWVRAISDPEAHRLANTDDASSLFWSPDSRWIGFFSESDHKVRKIAPAGGPAETMFALSTSFQEPVWGSKGDILYRPLNREPLYRISENGGPPVQVTRKDEQRTENSHRGQEFLPDGRRFLFVARCGDRAMNALYLGSLDSGKTTRIAPLDSLARFVAIPGTNKGRLFYHRDGGLVARTLNLDTEQLEGEPSVVLEHVDYNPTSLGVAFNVSANGRVAVWSDGPADLSTTLAWYSRQGVREAVVGEPDYRIQIRLSPDATRIVYAGVDPQSGNRDLFLMELARGIPTRLTSNVANDWYPAWSPDGNTVLFVSDRANGGAFSRPATNTSAEETRIYPDVPPEDWSRDGHWIAGFMTRGEKIWVAEAKAGAPVVPILPPSLGRSDGIRFSPDTRWIAYVSSESGQPEVYARRFFGTKLVPDAIQLSRGGGDFPVWNPKGGELFYVGRDRTLWSVNTRDLGSAPPVPVSLFRLCQEGTFTAEPTAGASYTYPWDTPDGKRFLVNCKAAQANVFKVAVNPAFVR